MMRARFDWRSSKWASIPEKQAHDWIDVLERLRVENVERTLGQTGGGSAAEISIGGVFMTKGFAEDWLAAKYAERENREVRSRRWRGVSTVLGWIVSNITKLIGVW
jgi:hypothetical protein